MSPEPWSGNLGGENLPAILRRVFHERRTGRLTLSREGESLRLFFQSGELRTASSSVEGRRIGDVLLRRGLVSEADFRAALASEGQRRGRLGKLLVSRGLVAQNVLDAEMRRLSEEIVFSAFTWKDGAFEFEDDEGSPDADVWLDHSTAALIVDGIRRLPDSEEYLERLGDLERRPAAVDDPMTRYGVVKLAPQEGYLFSLCNGSTSLKDIVRLAPTRAAGAKILHALLACGLIEIPEHAPPRPAAARPEPAPAPEAALAQQVAVDSAPDDEVRYAVARGSYVRARQLMDSRDFFGAIVLLEECVRLAPESPEYHYRLACALAKNPRWGERTISQFKKALDLAPGRLDAMRDFAEFLLSRKRTAEAREYASRLFDRAPEEPRHAELLDRCEAAMGIARPPAPASLPEPVKGSRSILGRFFRRDSEDE
jgi:tetratricopeptide (TPR) repeat protein